MESADSREKYGLRTKYRVRQGNYGTYCGQKSIDSEEIIRSTAVCTEDEMLFLRGVHWLVWYGWNHGFLKSLFKYVRQAHDLNPIDLILQVLKGDKSKFPKIERFFREFYDQAASEWFESHEQLEAYYFDERNWQDLLTNGYSKIEFVGNATMVIDTDLYADLLAYICEWLEAEYHDRECREIARVLLEARVECEDLLSGLVPVEKKVRTKANVAQYFVEMNGQGRSDFVELAFSKSNNEIAAAKASLLKFEVHGSRRLAVEKTLSAEPNAFNYLINFVGSKTAEQGTEIQFLERVS